jgi:hypothetical protein
MRIGGFVLPSERVGKGLENSACDVRELTS